MLQNLSFVFSTNGSTYFYYVKEFKPLLSGYIMKVIDTSGVPRNFVGGGGSTNSVEDRGQREQGSGGGSPLVRGSGGSCNFVQEISFHIVKFS